MVERGQAFIKSHNGKWFGVLVDDERRLVASAFSDDKLLLSRHLGELAGTKRVDEKDHPLLSQMVDVYEGRGSSKIALDLGQVSAYQQRVYSLLRRIPKGKVTTYGLIAQAIGSGPRAVGNAVASNRYAPFVPCHRVVPSDLRIGNYSMNQKPSLEGSEVKREILINEGVQFRGDTINQSSLWKPEPVRSEQDN